jgi:hypothetical protein
MGYSFSKSIFVEINCMKKILLFLVVILFAACSDTTSKIKGKWKLEEIDYSNYFESVSEEVRQFLQEQMKSEFKRLKNKTFFEFKLDNTVLLEAPDFVGKQTLTNGKWSVNASKDSLFLELADSEAYKIITLNDSEMVLTTDDAPNRVLRFSKVKR